MDTHTRGNRRGPALSQLRLGEGSEQAGIFKRRETRESKGQGGSGAGCPVTEHCGKNWSSNLSSRAGQDMRTQHLERRVLGLLSNPVIRYKGPTSPPLRELRKVCVTVIGPGDRPPAPIQAASPTHSPRPAQRTTEIQSPRTLPVPQVPERGAETRHKDPGYKGDHLCGQIEHDFGGGKTTHPQWKGLLFLPPRWTGSRNHQGKDSQKRPAVQV